MPNPSVLLKLPHLATRIKFVTNGQFTVRCLLLITGKTTGPHVLKIMYYFEANNMTGADKKKSILLAVLVLQYF